MSDRSCQTMLSFPVSVQIRWRRNSSTRSIVTVAMNIQRNCGRNKEKGGGGKGEKKDGGKSRKKKIQLYVTDRSVPISIFRSFLEEEIRLLSPVRNDCPPKPSLIHAISNCYYFIIGSI